MAHAAEKIKSFHWLLTIQGGKKNERPDEADPAGKKTSMMKEGGG